MTTTSHVEDETERVYGYVQGRIPPMATSQRITACLSSRILHHLPTAVATVDNNSSLCASLRSSGSVAASSTTNNYSRRSRSDRVSRATYRKRKEPFHFNPRRNRQRSFCSCGRLRGIR